MLFNSLDFAVFLPIVFLIYWYLDKFNLKVQNAFIVLASFLFYGWWDWRFLILMIITASTDFFVGISLDSIKNQKKRKLILSVSLLVNLGVLGFFKYFNFFIENFIALFSFFGYSFNYSSIQIVLPVGISFYTFQAMSYTIDVYKNELRATKSFINYFAFISFFPQLVAGPIERATHLLPQFYQRRTFNIALAKDGMRQILWGLFKKIVIADNAAIAANLVFNNHSDYTGSTLLLGSVFFAFQIYGDFSGYSDIALGCSKLFGFNLMRNFAYPYFSRDIAEFWRRWHISLSTWFRDYVYFPLGGSRKGMLISVRNTFIIFLLSGFWHGANWTFLIWGLLNAIYFLPLLLAKKNRVNTNIVSEGRLLPSMGDTAKILLTFLLTTFAWIFFRAETARQGLEIISHIFDLSFFSIPDFLGGKSTLLLIIITLIIEWLNRDKEHGLYLNEKKIPIFFRNLIYTSLILTILFMGATSQSFIYFQF